MGCDLERRLPKKKLDHFCEVSNTEEDFLLISLMIQTVLLDLSHTDFTIRQNTLKSRLGSHICLSVGVSNILGSS